MSSSLSSSSSSSSFVRRSVVPLGSALERGGGVEEDALPKGCRLTASGTTVTSLGVPSLDRLLLAGLPLGTALSIREDWPRSSSNYSSLLLKCIMAEGICSGQGVVLLDCVEPEGRTLLSALPAPVKGSEDGPTDDTPVEEPKLTIAWRYRHLRPVDDCIPSASKTAAVTTPSLRSFDLSRRLPAEELARRQGTSNVASILSMSVFEDDYGERFLAACGEAIQNAKKRGSVARIVIRSLASPTMSDAVRLLHRVKRLVCSHLDSSLLVYSLPAHGLAGPMVADLESLGDAGLALQSFVGTAHANNRSLAEYNGFFRLARPLRIPGTLALALPETIDLAFKIRRRQFVVETFHLPPDLSETPSRTADASQHLRPSSGCSATAKGKLDF